MSQAGESLLGVPRQTLHERPSNVCLMQTPHKRSHTIEPELAQERRQQNAQSVTLKLLVASVTDVNILTWIDESCEGMPAMTQNCLCSVRE